MTALLPDPTTIYGPERPLESLARFVEAVAGSAGLTRHYGPEKNLEALTLVPRLATVARKVWAEELRHGDEFAKALTFTK